MASVSKRKWKYNGIEREAWAVRFFDAKGKHCQKTFERKKDADKFKQQVERDLSDGTHVSRSDGVLIRVACDEFMRLQEDRMRRGSIGRGRYVNMKKTIDLNVVPILGHRKLHDVTAVDVEDWFRVLTREHGLSAHTARGRLADLNLLFMFGRRRGYLKVNPAPDAIKEIGSIPHVKVDTFSVSQVRTLLSLLEERPRYEIAIPGFEQPRKGITIEAFKREGGPQKRAYAIFRCMVHIAAFCGLRVSEIRSLRVSNVDLIQRVIRVRHSLDGWNNLKGPKTRAGIRDVPMPEHIADMVQEIIAEHYVQNDLELIFATRGGRPVPMPDFRLWWYYLLKRAGLYREEGGKQFHFHALRHFATSSWIASNLPPQIAANLAGHSHFDTTLGIYTHIVDEGDRRGMLTIEDMSKRLTAA